jgi:hypothetical protein
MPRYSIVLLISVFSISAVLHIFLQHKIAQCRQPRNEAFYSGWLAGAWSYPAAYSLIKYGLRLLLMLPGFGPSGIRPHSIAAWIQSVYGVSSIFSLLQSTGARAAESSPLLKTIGLAPILQAMKNWLWGHDYVAECVYYYEWWLTFINTMDLAFVVCYAFYWFFTRRR